MGQRDAATSDPASLHKRESPLTDAASTARPACRKIVTMPRTLEAQTVSKVPEVTLLFWILKIAATTLGETAGDAVSMSLGLGYLAGTAIFAAAFAIAVAMQIRA